MVEKQPLQQIVLTLLLIWAFAAQLTYLSFGIYRQAHASEYVELPFDTQSFSTLVSKVPASYSGVGLQTGDNIFALGGVPFTGQRQLAEVQGTLRPASVLAITVERASGSQTVRKTVTAKLHRLAGSWIDLLGLAGFLPLSCLAVGFYIAFARPRDPLAWIALAMLASVGQITGEVSWAIASPWRELLIVYHALLGSTWPLWLVLFGLYFPSTFPGWNKWEWIVWAIAAPWIAFSSLTLYGYWQAGEHLRELGWLSRLLSHASIAINVCFSLYVGAFFALLGRKTALLQNPDAKRRLSLMSTGCTVALTPLLPVVFFNLPPWLETICLLMVAFFPITMAYVIVVQRAMDVRTVVRSGVRYALAKQGIQFLRVAISTVLVVVALRLGRTFTEHWEGLVMLAIGVLLVATVGRVAKRVSRWMDRRFFREAYNAELILSELSSSVASIRDIRALLQIVAGRIGASLHVERIAVLLAREKRYEPAYAMGFDMTPPSFAPDSTTVRYLKQSRAPARIYFEDPQSWIFGAPESEQETLRTLHTQLLLPVSLDNRLLGMISLGPKKSELPYSQGDLQLLGAVASQTGLAIENAELTQSIRNEIAQRERLDRELEIARDVQQHLFPQQLPQVEGVDFAGYCRPALGVGGDYYDFLRLPGDCLGIAVGDVSGKGIAAALMMASLQASLRGQTIKPCETLSEMIGNINQLVFEASASNRYATFFYAQYEPRERVLRFVNAGHNAPLIFRPNAGPGKDILRLVKGGTVVGLFAHCVFEEGREILEPGDILLAFTDGISEAMNQAEEEFEEERLIQALRSGNSRSAADLISALLQKVDGFTAGARQHDDMTLVAMRVQ